MPAFPTPGPLGVYGALLSSHSEQLLSASIDPQWQAQVAGIASRVVAGDMPAAMGLLPEPARAIAQPVARQAFVGGFSGVLWVAGLLGLLGALVVGILMRKPIPQAPQPCVLSQN